MENVFYEYWRSSSLATVADWARVSGLLSSLLNPVIYALRYAKFRKAIRHIFVSCWLVRLTGFVFLNLLRHFQVGSKAKPSEGYLFQELIGVAIYRSIRFFSVTLLIYAFTS